MPATSAGMTAVSVAPQKQNTGEMFSPVSNCFAVTGLVVVNPRIQNAPSRIAPTNTNTAHTASTLSFKAWSTCASLFRGMHEV
jgi:hypothetical protein